MEEERLFVIGDIHGCLDMLKRLMDKIDWEPDKDRLIFIGDYIDRGTDSSEVIEYILTLKRLSTKVECLLGNHEAAFLDYINDEQEDMFLNNGGTPTLVSYSQYSLRDEAFLVPPEHLRFYNSLKLYIELKDYYVVHAGFRPGIPIEYQSREDMLWIRKEFLDSTYDFGKRVIFGHSAFKKPLVLKNKIGIDTGAVYGNLLTCVQLPELIFHSVSVD